MNNSEELSLCIGPDENGTVLYADEEGDLIIETDDILFAIIIKKNDLQKVSDFIQRLL